MLQIDEPNSGAWRGYSGDQHIIIVTILKSVGEIEHPCHTPLFVGIFFVFWRRKISLYNKELNLHNYLLNLIILISNKPDTHF